MHYITPPITASMIAVNVGVVGGGKALSRKECSALFHVCSICEPISLKLIMIANRGPNKVCQFDTLQ